MHIPNPEKRMSKTRIGARIRVARISRHLTMKQVGEACSVTESFISRLERDLVSPSIDTLLLLCDVLNLDIGDLLSPTQVAFVELESAPQLVSSGEGTDERLLTPRQDERLEVVHATLPAGSSGSSEYYGVSTPVHFIHVLEGGVQLQFDHKTWSLSQGDSLTFDGKEEHIWRSDNISGAVVLWCLIPGNQS